MISVIAGRNGKTIAPAAIAALLAMPLLMQLTNMRPANAKADDHSAARAENLSFEPFTSNSGILGLNYLVGTHGYPVISDIYKGSPADKAGLKVGDEIMVVGGNDTRYMGYLHLQPLLAGESGAQVTLKVRSEGGSERTLDITRASVASFKDPNLHKYEVAKWRGHSDLMVNEPGKTPDHLIDLPFALLSVEHNRPTLFEFTDKEDDPGVLELLKKHSDGSYIMNQCRVVRITRADPGYAPLSKYLSLRGSYALIPVYQPWLVTVKESDILTSLPTKQQLDYIAKTLVHTSIKVQVSHAVAKQRGDADAGQKLNSRAGLFHKSVLKRIYQTLPSDDGIIGLGFAAGSGGYATITQVFARGPAEKAGIKDGDQLITIDGQDTRYLGLEHIQADLTGPIGHSVNLQLRSQASDKKGGDGSASEGKKISLKFEPLGTFNDQSLTKITISTWKQVLSTNADDSDEYELPCCMLARAKDKTTIFEFCDSVSGPGLQETVDRLKQAKKLPSNEQDLQLVRYSPEDKDFETLRKYFKITSSYACLPAYSRSRHKTLKANQIILELPASRSDRDMDLVVEKLMPEQLSKSTHNDAKTGR